MRVFFSEISGEADVQLGVPERNECLVVRYQPPEPHRSDWFEEVFSADIQPSWLTIQLLDLRVRFRITHRKVKRPDTRLLKIVIIVAAYLFYETRLFFEVRFTSDALYLECVVHDPAALPLTVIGFI